MRLQVLKKYHDQQPFEVYEDIEHRRKTVRDVQTLKFKAFATFSNNRVGLQQCSDQRLIFFARSKLEPFLSLAIPRWLSNWIGLFQVYSVCLTRCFTIFQINYSRKLPVLSLCDSTVHLAMPNAMICLKARCGLYAQWLSQHAIRSCAIHVRVIITL